MGTFETDVQFPICAKFIAQQFGSAEQFACPRDGKNKGNNPLVGDQTSWCPTLHVLPGPASVSAFEVYDPARGKSSQTAGGSGAPAGGGPIRQRTATIRAIKIQQEDAARCDSAC